MWLKHMDWWPIPFFLSIICVLAVLDFKTIWLPYGLLPALNIIFLTIISLVVALIAARSFLLRRSISVLLLGCGALILSLGSAVAGFSFQYSGAGVTAAIYNSSLCLSALCHLGSAFGSISAGRKRLKSGWPALVLSYVASASIVFTLLQLIRSELWPVLLVQGSGPTFLGRMIEYLTAALLVISSYLFLRSDSTGDPGFFRWYGLGLAFFAVGMMGVSLQKSIGDAVNWVARSAQYAGGLYILAAIVTVVREQGEWLLPWEKVLHETENRYRLIVENAPEGIWITDKDDRTTYVNERMATMLEYTADRMIGEPMVRFVEREFSNALESSIAKARAGEQDRREVIFRREDGASVWTAISISPLYDITRNFSGIFAIISDITERRQMEEALSDAGKRMEEDLRAVTRLQQIGALYIQEGNLETVLTEFVDAAIAISNSDFGNIQLLDRESSTLKIAAHRGFPDWWLEFWNSVSHGQRVCGTALGLGAGVIVEDVEQSPIFTGTPALEIQLKAGVRSVHSIPLISRSGKLLGMISTHWKKPHKPDERELRLKDLLIRQLTDIIERAEAEKSERMAYERLKHFVDSNIVGVVTRKADGTVIEANEYYLDLLGFSIEELMQGRVNWRAVTPPEWLLTDEKAISELKERGRTTPYEKEYARRDETRAFVLAVDFLLPGESGNITSCVLDITTRKNAERLARDQLLELESLYHNAHVGLCLLDRDLRFVRVNERLAEINGLSASDHIGKTVRDVVPGVADIAEPALREAIETGVPVINIELTGETASQPGINRSWMESWLPILDRDGKVAGLNVVVIETTEQKRIEQELRTLAGELERSNKELELFTYMAAHDLQEPLRKITIFADRLSVRCREQLDANGKDYLSRMESAASRMKQMINGVLQLARIRSSGKDFEKIDLAQVLRDVKEDLELRIAERKAAVDVGEMPVIEGDQMQMRQLFQNLVENALKYSGDNPCISVRSRRVDTGAVEISVEDNGIGFSEEYADMIFMPLQRLQGRGEGEGIGMGLAICQRIVERHKGRISATSEPGKGSTFMIILPS